MATTSQDWLRLHLTPGLGRAGLTKLVETFGSAHQAMQHSRSQWRQHAGLTSLRIGTPPATDDQEFINAWQKLYDNNVQIISLWDDNYPDPLRTIYDPPALLYVSGTIPKLPSVAIVGSRKASNDGIRFANEIATNLSRHNVTVVSGLARGIDTAAHRGALTGSGATVAVLGCGIDRIYPSENKELFRQISNSGAVVSEYPPGTAPLAGHFPARNRIISGLCAGVLVVEAAHKSGSLITADFALDQGRDVYAAPGSIYTPGCQGNLELLKQGALLTTSADDILATLNISSHHTTQNTQQQPQLNLLPPAQYDLDNLSKDEKTIFNLLRETPLHLDQLTQESGLTAMNVSAIVLNLELERLATHVSGGRYLRGITT